MGYLKLSKGGMPQDIRVSPDGSIFYVADMMADGVFVVDGGRRELDLLDGRVRSLHLAREHTGETLPAIGARGSLAAGRDGVTVRLITIEPALDLILVSRHLERIGDHATNVAEDVIFMVLAKDVRHHAAEGG